MGTGFPEVFFTSVEPTIGLLCIFNFYHVVVGIGIGLAFTVCSMYIGEISPAEILKLMVVFNQFAIIFGMLVIFFVNCSIAKEEPIEWINSTG